jgi:site-specific DNA-methyltransferase (cytosine-N4-specific)
MDMRRKKKVDLLSKLPRKNIEYRRNGGAYFVGDSLKLLSSKQFDALKGRVNLILTSPPYPLNNKKSYGNRKGNVYLDWFMSLAPIFSELLAEDGSIVLEIGNAWEPHRPVQSLLHLESLLGFVRHEQAGLRLIQQFICYNPSRLPSPAQWVTVNRIRTVDSFTHVWWIAKTDYPKSDNSKVLRPYSGSMKSLLERGSYNSGKRPSEHTISENGFLTDKGGSIAHNLFELEPLDAHRKVRLPNVFSMSNSASNDYFHRECKSKGITPHPARMPMGLASFFIEFLTDKEDLVLDPFAGSNTTGYSAARAGRRWLSMDIQNTYVEQSLIRFDCGV